MIHVNLNSKMAALILQGSLAALFLIGASGAEAGILKKVRSNLAKAKDKTAAAATAVVKAQNDASMVAAHLDSSLTGVEEAVGVVAGAPADSVAPADSAGAPLGVSEDAGNAESDAAAAAPDSIAALGEEAPAGSVPDSEAAPEAVPASGAGTPRDSVPDPDTGTPPDGVLASDAEALPDGAAGSADPASGTVAAEAPSEVTKIDEGRLSPPDSVEAERSTPKQPAPGKPKLAPGPKRPEGGHPPGPAPNAPRPENRKPRG